MYIYYISKPNNIDVNKIYDENELSEYIVINENDIKEDMYNQLLPFCHKIKAIRYYYNLKKISEDYNISNPQTYMYSGGFVGMHSQDDDKRIKLSYQEIEEKYTISKEEIVYITNEEEVEYWGKEYDIQEWFYDHLNERVENTGYYRLSNELINEFNKDYPDDFIEPLDENDNGALFYWEWY